jgi:LacI family transcriptional regulator
MRVTIKDIAKVANVSYSTVSRALTGQPQIPEETRKKILKVANSMGYTPNALAKGLVTKSTYTLGLIVPDIVNPFFPEVIQGIEECATNYGYRVYLCTSNWKIEKEKECLHKLYGSSVDGILIFPASDDVSHITDSKINIPIVFVNHKPACPDCSYVAVDDFKSAILAVEYLLKLGHRKIAYVGGLETNGSNIERINGFKTVMGNYGIPIRPEYIVYGEYKQSSGYQLTKELLIDRELPTAIIAGDDLLALGIIQAIEEFGLKVPKDISVIGFDDISYASLDKIQLTTICIPRYVMGETSVELLIKKIQHPEDAEVRSKILETNLVVRKTCRGV